MKRYKLTRKGKEIIKMNAIKLGVSSAAIVILPLLVAFVDYLFIGAYNRAILVAVLIGFLARYIYRVRKTETFKKLVRLEGNCMGHEIPR